jgi:iron complex outermembrane recepter protein
MGQYPMAALTGAFLLLAATPGVYAQSSEDEQSNSAENPKVTEVVVTGSRIRRESGFDYPVPVAVISGTDLQNSGYTVLGDALANLPQALNTTSIQNTSGTLFASGESRVDLRGLGDQRTLVLVDGRRHLTGDFRTSAVDLNVIPSTMIERVEAISGGASAVYGSEAIAGVVNIILRKKYDGFQFDLQGGQTQENDGREWKGSLGYGFNFAADRGHFLIGAEFGRVNPILRVNRDWAYPGIRRNTAVSPQTIVPQSKTNSASTATFQLVGGNNTATARSVTITPDYGAVVANSPACATATVSPLCQDPQLSYSQVYDALQGAEKRGTARTYLGFDLTEHATVYADLSYAHVEGDGIFQPAFSTATPGGLLPVVLHGDNAYLNGPSPLAAQLRGFWSQAGLSFTQASTANVGKFWQEFGDRDSLVVRENYRAVTGVQGSFGVLGRDVDYDVYGQYGELDGYAVGFNVPNIQRVVNETDAVALNGQIVCRNATARANGCVPWDLVDGPSPAAVAWANASSRANGVAHQSIAAANFSTQLFRLPAGEVGFALGGEYRKEESDQIQDPLSASGALFYNALGRTKGGYNIREGYAEVQIPLLRDLPFVHRLSVEAAGRIGDYSTVGRANQWRLAAEWAPVEDIRFRGSSSTAVRAPNITELYAPQGQNFTTLANDPCDKAQIAAIQNNPAQLATRVANCQATIPGYNPATFVSNIGTGRPSLELLQGGNPNLNAETADTFTAGFVVQPHWIEGLQMSVDYWRVNVKGAVSTIPVNTLLQNLCYDVSQAPDSNHFCSLIHRDPTGAITYVELTNQNVQAIRTNGLDMSASYRHAFGPVGRLSIQLDGTQFNRWDLEGAPGGPVTHYAGLLTGPNSATPRYKVTGSLNWDWHKLGLTWVSHWLSSLGVSETLPSSFYAPFYTGSYFEHDVVATYRVSNSLTFRAGAINVTNAIPPQLPETAIGNTANSAAYDNRGRWFYVGVNYSQNQ